MANTQDGEQATTASSSIVPFKVVLPRDLLKDLEGTEASRCLDKDSKDGFFYLPDFISEAEEAYIISKIQSAPQPKWRTLQNRRLQNWGGLVSKQVLIPEPLPDFLTQFPDLVARIRDTGIFEQSKHGQPNHCLMNEYEAGQGIMPHEDGGAYYPVVATISLGSQTMLDVYRYVVDDAARTAQNATESSIGKAREQAPRFSFLQEPRSLLITSGAAYRHFLHGIAERTQDDQKHLASVTNGDMLVDERLSERIRDAKEDKLVDPLPRSTRWSLTLRDVERVAPPSLLSKLNKR